MKLFATYDTVVCVMIMLRAERKVFVDGKGR